MKKSELMKRYEAKTGKVMSRLMRVFQNPSGYSKEELANVMTELFIYSLYLEDQLRWRPVSEKPEKAGLYWCELLDNETGNVHHSPCQYVGGWLGRYQVIRYVPIPPAPEGDKQ